MRHAALALGLLLSMTALGQTLCDQLNAGFTASATSGTGAIQFSNGTTGTGQSTTWQWSFGDGTTSNDAQPLHEFPGPGTYEVCLTAITIFIFPSGESLTCVDEYCAPVTVGGVNNCSWLSAGFTYTTGSNGIEFHYQPNGPTGVQYSYSWSFGDGGTASTQNVFHVYTVAGTYEVCLTVTAYTTAGVACTATSCQAVTSGGGGNLCDQLAAGFTYSAAGSGNGVIFSNGTTGTGFQTTWTWYFGDGATSADAQPDHAYAEPGTYNVCLVATTIFETSAGLLTCVDEYCAPVVITGGSNPCDQLNAGFTASATSGTGAIQFSNGTTGTGQSTTWQWSFGDGTTSNDAQPLHEFPGPGTYEVCLTAITIFIFPSGESLTCVDEYCAPVTVGGVNNCSWLSAGFTYTTGSNGIEFHYQPNGPTGVQYSYSWSFGDGGTASTQNVFHVYTVAGTYEVCLTVTAYTTAGVACTATSCQAVTSGGGGNLCDQLAAGFTYSAAGSGNGVIFSNGTTGTGFQTTWTWYFGDGATSADAQPDHAYAEPGTYNVCLVATTIFETSAGLLTCVDEYCAPVVVGSGSEECDPSFALEIDSEPSGAGFILTASTNIPNGGITWTFANGLVLYGSSIQVGLSSVLNIELCITAWYQPANSTDTCWVTVCGLLSELGFAVSVDEMEVGELSVWPNPASDFLYVGTGALNKQARITIVGVDGRVERELIANGSPARVDLSGLAAGLKSVSVAVGNRMERFKVVKE